MNAKIFIILFACFCYARGCCKNECSGGSYCHCERHKRSVVEEKTLEKEQGTIDIQLKEYHYRVKLLADPCNFETYDKNRDGFISVGELVDIFGVDMITEGVFKDIDVMKDDGAITQEEFDANVSIIVPECKHTSL